MNGDFIQNKSKLKRLDGRYAMRTNDIKQGRDIIYERNGKRFSLVFYFSPSCLCHRPPGSAEQEKRGTDRGGDRWRVSAYAVIIILVVFV